MRTDQKKGGALNRSFLLLAALVMAVPACAAQPSPLQAPEAQVAGATQDLWSQRWWQWAASFSQDESPVADRTGSLCGSHQSGPVWFLAGTYETQRTVRACEVPAGKYLFFPLINYVVMPRSAASLTCAGAAATAARVTDGVSSLVLDVDGHRYSNLERHRFTSPGCFDLTDGVPGAPPIYPSAANGYYVMLAPLSPGRHEINFGGVLPGMAQAVTYRLVVR